MLEIKFDVTKLNHEERQDLASFILGWPERIEHATLHIENVADDNPFASETPPLPAGATAAPISAGAVPLPTAHEDMTATTSSIPAIPASVPHAPSIANGAAPAALLQTSHVELDSEGLPWDSRIHSSSRGRIANGTWKLMRGANPAFVDVVKAELRALMSAKMIADNSNYGATPPKSHYLIDQPGAVIDLLPPASDDNIVSGPAPIRHGFVDFIEDITQRLVSKKLTQADIIKSCTDAGIAAPNLLATRPDLIPQVARALDAIANE